MGARCRKSDRATRAVMRSPGRPSVACRGQRQRFWAAIARGVSTVDAAGEAGVSEAVGVRWFREGGGMPTVTQAPLSGRYLSFAEREEIAILRARGYGVREIARSVGRSPSTISRELRRNAATRSGALEYRATTAQWHAELRAKRPKTAKLVANEDLQQYVQDRLAGAVARPDGSAVAGQRCAGLADVTGAAQTAAGARRGALSRSLPACESISPMMSRCGSRTRRSTRRCMSRVAERYGASSQHVCGLGGRCAFPEPAAERAARAS